MLLKIDLSAPPGGLVHFAAEDAPPLGLSPDAPGLLREAHLLHAGTFNGVERVGCRRGPPDRAGS